MLTKINSMQILKWTIYVFFACSFALLSFYQLVYYQKWFIIFTVLFSFLFFLYFLRKTGKQNWEYIKSHRTISGMLLLLSIDVYKRQGNALSDGNCHGFYSRGFRQGHSGAFG